MGTITQRSENKFRVQIKLGQDATGKNIFKSQTITGTRTDAKTALKALEHQYFGVDPKTMAQMSVNDVVARHSQAKLSADAWKPAYAQQMDNAAHRIRDSFLGAMDVSEVKVSHCNQLVTNLRLTKVPDSGILTIQKLLSGSFNRAVVEDLMATNPMTNADWIAARRRNIQVPTEDQLAKVLGFNDDIMLRTMLWLLIGTGMRRGELCGLQWSDVRVESDGTASLSISRNIIADPNVKGRLKFAVSTTKTINSDRTIYLDADLTAELVAYRNSKANVSDTWMFAYSPTQPNQFMTTGKLQSMFYRVRQELGCPNTTLHHFRHAHAVALLASGVDPKTAATRLGNDPMTLLRTYSHKIPSLAKEASAKVASLRPTPQ